MIAQPATEGVAGVFPLAPVPQPTVDDAGLDGLVVAFPQVIEYLLVQGRVAARPGLPYPRCAALLDAGQAGPAGIHSGL